MISRCDFHRCTWNKHSRSVTQACTSFPIFLSSPFSLPTFRIAKQDHIVLTHCPFIPLCLAGKHRRYHTSRITTTTTNCLRVLRNLHRFPTFSDWVATFYDRFRTPLRQREKCGDWFRTRQQEVSDFYEWIQLCNNSGAIQSCTDYDANR